MMLKKFSLNGYGTVTLFTKAGEYILHCTDLEEQLLTGTPNGITKLANMVGESIELNLNLNNLTDKPKAADNETLLKSPNKFRFHNIEKTGITIIGDSRDDSGQITLSLCLTSMSIE